jgi:penicillin-binding protein 1C
MEPDMLRFFPLIKKFIHPKRLAAVGTLLFLAATGAWLLIPDYRGDLDRFSNARKIVDRNGNELRTVLHPDEQYCEPVSLDKTGKWSGPAIVAFEDKRFYKHAGIDPVATTRALAHNIIRRRVVSGASTISTLVVKMTEPRTRNLGTKVIEAHHAIQLEQQLTKDQLLEQYLNRAPFGGNIIGIEAASRRYFGKPAETLSLGESALLVGIPQSPNRLRPDRHPERAIKQRKLVLSRMLNNGTITAEQYNTASTEPITIRSAQPAFRAPHFCDMLLQKLPTQSKLHTTLDLEIQTLAEDILRRHIQDLKPHGVHGGAVVILDVKTGTLLAMVGSPDFLTCQVNGATAHRSPASTLKPFAFATAFDQGQLTPASILADIPTQFSGYSPENYNRQYAGPVTVRDALVQSLNIPALRCVEQIGTQPFIQQLQKLGLTTLDRSADHYGLGIAVGSCEATLLELANAYATLARQGTYIPLRVLTTSPQETPEQIFTPAAAYMIADILSGDERAQYLTGHCADTALPRIAWKTGTSSAYRDAWTLAYNPEYVVGVWVGNPDGTPSPKLLGNIAAAPIAGDIFRRLYPDGHSPWYAKPATLKTRQVCAVSGNLPCRFCTDTITDYCIDRVTHTKHCSVHHRDREQWPEPIQAFLNERGMSNQPDAPRATLSINTPSTGATYHLLPDLAGTTQKIKLSATSTEEPYWFIDSQPIGRGQNLFWPPTPGTHTITCSTANGQTDQIKITVEM